MVQKTSLRATLIEMEAGGEPLTVSLEGRSLNAIRNCASNLGIYYPGRKYQVLLNREQMSCTISRLS